MGLDGIGSPGGRGYRAPYGANNCDVSTASFVRFTHSDPAQPRMMKMKMETATQKSDVSTLYPLLCTYQTHSLRSSFTLRGVRHFPSSANISSHATSPTLSKEVNISMQPVSDTHTDRLPEKSTINGVMRLLLARSLHNSLPMSNIQTFPHHH